MKTIRTLGVAGTFAAAALWGQNMTDQQFVDLAAQVNMTEAHLGQLAQNKATKEDIKEYGRRLQSDHKAAYDKLANVATGFTVPKAIDPQHKILVDRFEKLSGDQFDTQFRQTVIDEHQKAIEKFEQANQQISSMELKSYANQQLPVLRDHLQAAQNLGKPMTSKLGNAPARGDEVERTRTAEGAATGQRTAAAGGQTTTHHGTITQYEPGKMLVLKVRDRVGRHAYDLAEGRLLSQPPADLAVGKAVIVTEMIDKNGRRAIKIEHDMSEQRSRTP